MRVLITGIGGFVGRHLARHLSAAGYTVHGLTLSEADAVIGGKVEVADLCEPAEVERVIEKCAPQAVIHLAGMSRTNASRQIYQRVNVGGTSNLIDALRDRDVEKVIFASSGMVYGQVAPEQQPIREERSPKPNTPYGESKAAAERIVLGHPKGIVVRSFNTIGPGQERGFVLPDLAHKLIEIREGREKTLQCKDLKPELDFLHISDAVAGYRAILEAGQAGQVYNLARGEACSIGYLLEQLLAISEIEVDVESQATDSRVKMLGDNQRLRELGWAPKKTVADAVRDFWSELTR